MAKRKYLAAVSGGPDSMALLDMYKDEIKAVCHVNYKTRDFDSDKDEERVIEFCQKHNIKYHVAHTDYTKYKIKNFQSWARIMRYEFFKRIYKLHDCEGLLTGHHKDDFIETAYFQEHNRGTKRLKYGFEENTIISGMNVYRPLIKFWKYELENYCKEHNINYGVDKTNLENKYFRNKVRNLIFKEWSFAQKQEYFDRMMKLNRMSDAKEKIVSKNYRQFTLSGYDLDFFKSLDREIKHLIILRYLSIKGLRISQNKVQGIIDFLMGDKLFKEFRIAEKTYLIVEARKIKIAIK